MPPLWGLMEQSHPVYYKDVAPLGLFKYKCFVIGV